MLPYGIWNATRTRLSRMFGWTGWIIAAVHTRWGFRADRGEWDVSWSKWEWEWHSCIQCLLVFCIRVRMSPLFAKKFGSFASSQMHHDPLCSIVCGLERWTVTFLDSESGHKVSTTQRSILNKACGSMLDNEFCRVLWQFVRRILRINNDAHETTAVQNAMAQEAIPMVH
jgi:hypothetical protein